MAPTRAAAIRLRRAAKLVGISDTTVYSKLVDTGFLMPNVPIFKIGGVYHVSRADLERALGPIDDAEQAS